MAPDGAEPSLDSRSFDTGDDLSRSAASVFHLAWAQVLSRLCGRDEVVFGTLLLGRMQGGVGVNRALGMFINTLPVLIRVGERGVRNTLLEVHESLAELMQHEHASLALAQRCSALPPGAQLFSTVFNYRHTAPPKESSPGIELLLMEERTHYPIGIAIDDLGKDFLITTQVDSAVGTDRICEYLQVAVQELLASLEARPQQLLRELEILPASERERLVDTWNRTRAPYPQGKLLQELFEAQVKLTPDAVAVEHEAEQLTYAQLNHRANQVAH